MKVVIVEDEPLAQNFLSKLLTSKYSDIEIVKILESVKDSISYFSSGAAVVQLRELVCLQSQSY